MSQIEEPAITTAQSLVSAQTVKEISTFWLIALTRQ